jgi:hypothetical protein
MRHQLGRGRHVEQVLVVELGSGVFLVLVDQ